MEGDKEIENMRALFVDNLFGTAAMMDNAFERFFKKFGISKVQFYALYLIDSKGEAGISLSSLGDMLSVTRANITTLIDRMEVRGLVKRIENCEDRRGVKVVATKTGNEILNEIVPDKEKFTLELFGFLNERELVRANELLERVQIELKKINI